MAVDRSDGRDVHIYSAVDPSTMLGGLIRSKGINNVNIYLCYGRGLFVFRQ